MNALHIGNFNGMLTTPEYRQNIAHILTHQEQYGNDTDHLRCGGFYATKEPGEAAKTWNLHYSVVRYRHHEQARLRRLGHIPESDWGNVGAYVSARDTLRPSHQDVAELAELHADNPYTIYGLAVPIALGGVCTLFLRHSSTKESRPERLEALTDGPRLRDDIQVLHEAGINTYVSGIAGQLVPGNRQDKLFL